MRGHWQREMPKRAGDFWTATRIGDMGGLKSVYKATDGTFKVVGLPWNGWWWSEPVKMPPAPPPWEAEPKSATPEDIKRLACGSAIVWETQHSVRSFNPVYQQRATVEGGLSLALLECEMHWAREEFGPFRRGEVEVVLYDNTGARAAARMAFANVPPPDGE